MSDEYIYNPLNPFNLIPSDIYEASGITPPSPDSLPTKGGTMTGPINMGGNPIMNAAEPVNPTDLATKKYVDLEDAVIQTDLDNFKILVDQQIALLEGNIQYGGNYDASTNKIAAVTPFGATLLTVGSPLPAAAPALERVFVIVTVSGTGISPAPAVSLLAGDWVLCTGSAWTIVTRSGTVTTADQVSFVPSGSLSSLNVQNAVVELDTEKFPVSGGTFTGPVVAPALSVTGEATVTGSLGLGAQGFSIKDGIGADAGKVILNIPSTTEAVVKGKFTVNDINYSAPLPASGISYDNTVSGLAGNTVQESVDEVALKVNTVAVDLVPVKTDLTTLKTSVTDLSSRVTATEAKDVSLSNDISGLQIESAALNTSVSANATAIASIRSSYLPLSGGNVSGALQISGNATLGGDLFIGDDASPFKISKPAGKEMIIETPVGGVVVINGSIAYVADPSDPLATKGYMDGITSTLAARISLLEGNVEFMGTYDASKNLIDAVAPAGVGIYTPGAPLPAATASNSRNYLIVNRSGTGSGEAPPVSLTGGDWVLSTSTKWDHIELSEDDYLPLLGGMMKGFINMGGFELTGLKNPVNPTDAAHKEYVEGAVSPVADDLTQLTQSVPVYLGTYNATLNKMETPSAKAIDLGLVTGSALPSASSVYNNFYVRVSVAGTGIAPAPAIALAVNDWVYCNGVSWVYYPMTAGGGSSGPVESRDVNFSFPTTFPGVTNVYDGLIYTENQNEIQDLSISSLRNNQENLISSSAICLGVYNVVTNAFVTVTDFAAKLGLSVGEILPNPVAHNHHYVTVYSNGTAQAPLPLVSMKANDWVYCAETQWVYYPMTGSSGGAGAYLPLAGGTLTGNVLMKATVPGSEINIKLEDVSTDKQNELMISNNSGGNRLNIKKNNTYTTESAKYNYECLLTEKLISLASYGPGANDIVSLKLEKGYIAFQNISGREVLLKSGPFGCISYQHQGTQDSAIPYPSPFDTMSLGIYISALSEIPSLYDLSETYVQEGHFKWSNVTASFALLGKTIPAGFYNLFVYNPFKNRIIYTSYTTFLNSAGDYYSGVFAKIKPADAASGQATDIKVLGKCELYLQSDMTTVADIGWIYTYPPTVPNTYGITLGLWIETQQVLANSPYVAIIKLPDSWRNTF